MAEVLDINILCKKIWNFNLIQNNVNIYNMNVKTITCIDNWRWENEQSIMENYLIEERLNQDKIIIINFESLEFKEIGLYIERHEEKYLYNFWINIEGYPTLSYGIMKEENTFFCKKLYEGILSVKEDWMEIIGIGIETDFYYSEKLEEIISKSQNIDSWIIYHDVDIRILQNYKEKYIKELQVKLYEKNTDAKITDFGNKVKNAKGVIIGDIDCATVNELIEIKTSIGSVKMDQIEKYVSSESKKFFNVNNKTVIIYIDEPIDLSDINNINTLNKIKEKGAIVVNGLEELKGVIQ